MIGVGLTDEEKLRLLEKHCPEVFRFDQGGFCRLIRCGGNLTVVQPCDPFSDLNAMHEAEKTLTDEEYHAYVNALYEVLGVNLNGPDMPIIRACISCSARQRADAFIQCLASLPVHQPQPDKICES